MYNVHVSRYPVSVARERLADLLDDAEAGKPVVIERRGVQYAITAVQPATRPRARRKLIASADAAIESGEWSWTWREGQLAFARPRSRR
jgi:antitoxin (DNA-binding transcriptional repressor) of toxin-antitoxin stability system